jgi:hypothetical protein
MMLVGLTLHQPMSWAIVGAPVNPKRIENRPRDLPRKMQGVEIVIAVHAGKKWDDRYAAMVTRLTGVYQPPYVRDGGLVGLMLLTGRVFTERCPPVVSHENGAPRLNPWYAGPFGYEIKHAVEFGRPIPCRGAQGWWPVPEHIEKSDVVQRALREVVQ